MSFICFMGSASSFVSFIEKLHHSLFKGTDTSGRHIQLHNPHDITMYHFKRD